MIDAWITFLEVGVLLCGFIGLTIWVVNDYIRRNK